MKKLTRAQRAKRLDRIAAVIVAVLLIALTATILVAYDRWAEDLKYRYYQRG